jgi:iron complex transport system ATP-binding protein
MLEIRNLTAGYRRKTILRHLSVDFEAGRLTAVVGPNGCGKSTLLKAILGMLPQTEGTVALEGEVLPGARDPLRMARRIAYLPQGQRVPDMTVEQMVTHGRFPYLVYPRGYTDRDRDLARAAMERVGIGHLAAAPMATLSGGLRQTAYLAMALAQDTPYLLLDEPSTYLDVAHQVALMRLLRELSAEGRGVVAVLHDLPLALTYADRVVVMDEGQIVAQGTPRDVVQGGALESVFGVSVAEADGAYFCRLP